MPGFDAYGRGAFRVRRSDPVLHVEIGADGASPSLHAAFVQGMLRLLEDARAEPAIRMIVLRGREEVFCTGMDLGEILAAPREGLVDRLRAFASLLQALRDLPKVSVAVVDGKALGGGVGLAAACDLVVAGKRASFCFTESHFGLIPAVVYRWVAERIGARRTFRLALSAETLDAERAERMGLADAVEEEPERYLRSLALRLARMGEPAVAGLKSLASGTRGNPGADGAEAVEALAGLLLREDVRARLEAHWTARQGEAWPTTRN